MQTQTQPKKPANLRGALNIMFQLAVTIGILAALIILMLTFRSLLSMALPIDADD